MTKPIRLKLSRVARFKLQDASKAINGLPARFCARPTVLGNPFSMKDQKLSGRKGQMKVVEQHMDWLLFGIIPKIYSLSSRDLNNLRVKALIEIGRSGGMNLACHCGVDEPCHVDFLLRLSNE